MRKINAILGPVLIVLLLIHSISGSFQLSSIISASNLRTVLSYVLLGVTGLHTVIGIILTIQTLNACKRAGTHYFKNNESFWIRRVSGLAIVLLVIYHVIVFTGTQGEAFRLNSFGILQVIAHIVLALALAIHLMFNIRPLCIAFGLENRKFIKDAAVILAIVMLAAAIAFIYYYLRWNVLWTYGGIG